MNWYEFEAMRLEVYLLRRQGKVSAYLVEELYSINKAVTETGAFSEDLQKRAKAINDVLESPVYKEYLRGCMDKESEELKGGNQ